MTLFGPLRHKGRRIFRREETTSGKVSFADKIETPEEKKLSPAPMLPGM